MPHLRSLKGSNDMFHDAYDKNAVKDRFKLFSSSLENQCEIQHSNNITEADLSSRKHQKQNDVENLDSSLVEIAKLSPRISARLPNREQNWNQKHNVPCEMLETDGMVLCLSESKKQSDDVSLLSSAKVSYRDLISDTRTEHGKDFHVEDEQCEDNDSTSFECTQKSASILKQSPDNEKLNIDESSDFKRNGSAKCPSYLRHNQWNAMFEQLKKYKADYGNCLVPSKYAPNMRLSRWVKEQRQQYRKLLSNGATCLNENRLRLLESIGFAWMAYDVVWMDRYNELKDFKKQHGHCLVPARYGPNQKLGRWVNKQRVYKKLTKDGQSTSLTESRSKMLDDLEFTWNAREASDTDINNEELEAEVTEVGNKQNIEVKCTVEDHVHKCTLEKKSANTSMKGPYKSETVTKTCNCKISQPKVKNNTENISDSDISSTLAGEIGKVNGHKATTPKRNHDEISTSATCSESIKPKRKICSNIHASRQLAPSARKTIKKEPNSIFQSNKEEQDDDQVSVKKNASITASISTEGCIMSSRLAPHFSPSPPTSHSISNTEAACLENRGNSMHENVLQDNIHATQRSILGPLPSMPPLFPSHLCTDAININNISLPSTTDQITAHTLNQMTLNQWPLLHNLAPSLSVISPNWQFSPLPSISFHPNLSTIMTRPSDVYPQMTNNMYLYWNPIVWNNNGQSLRNNGPSNEINVVRGSMHNQPNL